MRKRAIRLGRLVVRLVVWLAAAGAVRADKAPAKVTYDDHIMPILREKCFSCHGQDRKSGGLRLNSYSSVLQGGASGEAIKPGDADGSLLYQLVTHQHEPFMPPLSPELPKEMVEQLRAWIEGGALENAGSKAKMANKPKFDLALGTISRGKPAGPPPVPQHLNLEPLVRSGRASAITALAASPWAPVVAVGGQKQVLLYNSDTLVPLGVLPFPEGVPQVLRFSRNSKLLLAGGGRGGKSGRVVVWDVVTGSRLFEVGEETDAVLAADISPDQTQIALGGPSKVVRVYSTKDGKLLHEIKKHTDWITALEYSPDGVLLASGDRNGNLMVWEAFTAREYFTLRGHTASITDVSWRADANVLASGSEDGTIRLWEMENGNPVKAWGAGAGVESVKFAHDGRLVSCGRDRLVKLWSPAGAAIRALEPCGDVALRAAFSHDDQHIIAGDWTGEVRVSMSGDGKRVGRLSANPGSVVERLAQATQELPERQAAATRLAAAAAASQAAAQKATAELASAQQHAQDAGVVAKVVNDQLAHARQAAEQANAGVTAAQAQVAAREVVARAYQEAATRLKEAADKVKDNKEVATSAQQLAAQATHAAAELVAAQKQLAERQAAARSAGERLAEAQRASALTSATAAATAKELATRTAAAQALQARAAADQAAAVDAATALSLLQKLLDQLRLAVASHGGHT